jgi:hypothetical protein
LHSGGQQRTGTKKDESGGITRPGNDELSKGSSVDLGIILGVIGGVILLIVLVVVIVCAAKSCKSTDALSEDPTSDTDDWNWPTL